MIRAIIVDDEPKGVSALQKILADYCKDVEVLATAGNINDAKKIISENNPQLVFLDVEMPYGSGFDLLDSLQEITFEIIFVTAFNQYAINAFRYASLDYLLKPINIAQLIEASQRAVKRINEKEIANNYQLLVQNIKEKDPLKQKILFSDSKEQMQVEIAEIMYCIADGSYTDIYLTNNRRHTSSKNLKEFELMLPSDLFLRIHHSHIINLSHVKTFQKGRGGSVIMNDGNELEIAVRRKEDFLKAYNK